MIQKLEKLEFEGINEYLIRNRCKINEIIEVLNREEIEKQSQDISDTEHNYIKKEDLLEWIRKNSWLSTTITDDLTITFDLK